MLAAWETQGQVYFSASDELGSAAASVTRAPGRGGRRKHPVAVVNGKGETLFAWIEGMTWGNRGAVRWQLYDGEGRVTQIRGRAEERAPAWSLISAFADADGNFVVVY